MCLKHLNVVSERTSEYALHGDSQSIPLLCVMEDFLVKVNGALLPVYLSLIVDVTM